MRSASFITSVKHTYNSIAPDFSNSRQHLWPQITPILKKLNKMDRVLDLGCGNGRLLTGINVDLNYTGIDQSDKLIAIAKKLHPQHQFKVADITKSSTFNPLPQFDAIFCLAVMHHLPDKATHLHLLRQIKAHLKPTGFAYLSVWNLLHPQFIPFHVSSLPLKLHHPRWVNVPFNAVDRLHFTFDPLYLKSIIHQSGLQLQHLSLTDKKGHQSSLFSAANINAQVTLPATP